MARLRSCSRRGKTCLSRSGQSKLFKRACQLRWDQVETLKEIRRHLPKLKHLGDVPLLEGAWRGSTLCQLQVRELVKETTLVASRNIEPERMFTYLQDESRRS